jgi:hypothetical protein
MIASTVSARVELCHRDAMVFHYGESIVPKRRSLSKVFAEKPLLHPPCIAILYLLGEQALISLRRVGEEFSHRRSPMKLPSDCACAAELKGLAGLAEGLW